MLSFLFRHRILFGLFLALSLVIGEFWLYAANRLGGYMREKTFGGSSLADFCESSDVAGFPFRLKLSCSNLSATFRSGPDQITITTEEAQGAASIFAPNHVILTLSSPLTLQNAAGAPLAKLRHDGLTLDIAWSTSGLEKAGLDIASLDWRPETPEAGIAFNLQKLTAQADWLASATGGLLRFNFTGDGLTAPALQSLLQKNDLGHLSLSGQLTPAPAMASDLRTAAEEWRQKSGAIGIEKLEWRAGDSRLTIDGALVLDETHRPAGRLNLAASGAGPLLAQLGIPTGAAQVKNVIGALLGKPSKAEGGDTLTLPLNLAKGQVFLGPVRLPATLAPLY